MIRSKDGTLIATEVEGRGPPLVLVHGTSSSAARWLPVRAALAERFTLHVVERRGRGASGDGPSYALAHEVDDLLAVLSSIGEPAHVVAHSYGGLIALEAARVATTMRSLVSYEPPLNVDGGPIYPPAALVAFEARLAVGDREGVVEAFFRDVLGVDEATLARTRGLPSWPGRVAAAHTILREARATDAYVWDAARFASTCIPTRLFVGGASHPRAHEHSAVVAAALAHADVVTLPGQRHVAMDTAPQLFVEQVVAFAEGGVQVAMRSTSPNGK